MAPIEPMKSPVAAAIEAHYRDNQDIADDERLRCSKLGEECERALWYAFRWASPLERHDGRMVRLFQTGHREEARMIADLRAIGCDVKDRNPETGEQWRVELSPVLGGSADGVVMHVPGAERTEHLLECKTMNQKSYDDWRKKGVEASKPVHYAQMQLYMHGLGLSRALYIAHNKNTDEVETERVKYDPLVAAQLIAKAERIANADRPPAKLESFACKWCRHETLCRYDGWARVNCRTCLHAVLQKDGEWWCATSNCTLTIDDQKNGCGAHLFIPDLVPGAQVDADEQANTVTYHLRVEGREWVDGKDEAPHVPEIAE
jgi:hypothetical protein